MSEAGPVKAKFPRTFWTANTVELFERAAYYAMASFMVIYLKETLGMRPTLATFLNGSLLWGLIYFMPILSGTLADKYGYKRSLTVAFVLISAGYFTMGNVQRFWPGIIGRTAAEAIDFTVPVVLGIVLIGIGGSIVKPCIAGTVQKTSGTAATLGFGIFYMVINIGSITGRGVSYFIRTSLGIPAIFTYASSIFALIGLVIVLFFYREPEYVSDGRKDGQAVRKKTLGQAVLGIFVVLRNARFVFFLVVIGLFWVLYVQLYNLMPLFLRAVDPNAPMELYTLANPVMIVAFQMLITRLVKKWTPIKSILFGVAVTTTGMLMNVLPSLLGADLSRQDRHPRPGPAFRRGLPHRLDRLDGRRRDDGLAPDLRVHRGHRPQGRGGPLPGIRQPAGGPGKHLRRAARRGPVRALHPDAHEGRTADELDGHVAHHRRDRARLHDGPRHL